jgi:hypothetical protein
VNPQAQPYVFPTADNPELAAYLTAKTEHDPATGCLLWTGGANKHGDPRIWKTYAARFGSDRPARLAWQLCHGTGLGKTTKLVPTCGNPKCINPEHLTAAVSAAPQRVWNPEDDDGDVPPRRWTAKGGVFKVGNRELEAQRVFGLQSYTPTRDPAQGLVWHFKYALGVSHLDCPNEFDLLLHARRELEIIRAVRRCPIRATLTELPNGFRRYDLPAGVHKIAFTAPPPPSYEDVFGLVDDDKDPETAPAAGWALAA